ncbi:hypothetical protein [Winogradskya humida]|uniref:Phage-related protein n=1 Tax=Winogradskya humida TaxID=113566 RepID=A0ABQ3ZQR4_9ACTN|nr:hypothetical protein [Actinoplanes humidus]GIE20921.1 hypothetical protein Ahu01nite_040230 [Actinoplanes humidus]
MQLNNGVTRMNKQPDPTPATWTIEVCKTRAGREPFTTFLNSLNPYQRAIAATAIRTVLATRGHAVCETEWGKPLGKGLYEFRVRRTLAAICSEAGIDPPSGIPGGGRVLLRIFFVVYGDRIVLLLGGYNKGRDPSRFRQLREIRRARSILKEFRQDQ